MAEITSQLRDGIIKAEKQRGTGEKDGREVLSIEEKRELESWIALDYAKENGLWIKDIYALGVPFSSGNENTNVLNADNGVVYKSNNLMNSITISELLKRTQFHNQLFPSTKLELVGFTGIDNGENRPPLVEVLLKQQLFDDTELATPNEITNYMKLLGFKQIGKTSFTNGQYTVSDLYPRNVLKDTNGNLYVIDTEII